MLNITSWLMLALPSESCCSVFSWTRRQIFLCRKSITMYPWYYEVDGTWKRRFSICSPLALRCYCVIEICFPMTPDTHEYTCFPIGLKHPGIQLAVLAANHESYWLTPPIHGEVFVDWPMPRALGTRSSAVTLQRACCCCNTWEWVLWVSTTYSY